MVGKPQSAEMHPGPGSRLKYEIERPDPETVSGLSRHQTPDISDLMNRLYALEPEIKNMTDPDLRLVGPACTVKCYPGDNLMVHKALDIAEAGDVVVVDAGGDLTNALIGELMLAHAEHRGIAGIVINGAIRDSGAIGRGSYPVYAAGVTHRGPYKDGPGEINVPIALDGMIIRPGDLIVGDEDGLVCVPYEDLEAVFTAATKKHEAEEKQMAGIRRGQNDRAWVDQTLKRLGCVIEAEDTSDAR
jgi:RraA family protein